MPPRASIRHVISSVAPPEAEAGDEWWDVGTNKYYKYAIVSGSSPQWVEMAQQTVLQTITGTLVTFVNNLLIQPNTWTDTQTFSANAAFTSDTQSSSTTTGALTVSGGIGVSGNVRSGGNVYVNNNNSYILTDTTGSSPYLTCQNDNNLVLYSTEGVGVASNVDVNGDYPSGQTKSFLMLTWENGVAQIIWSPYSSSEYLFRKGQSVIIAGEWNPKTFGTIYTRDQIKASINTTQIVTECGPNYINFATTLASSSGAFYYSQQYSAGGYVVNASINPVGGRAALAIVAKNSLSSLQLLPGGGRVGIGTSSPTATLHVSGSDNPNYAYWTSIKVDGVSNNWGARLLLNNWEIAGMGSNNPPLSSLSFSDTNASATRMVIDSSGKMGIGTTAPTSLLTVNGNAEIGQVLNVGVLPPVNWNYGTGYAPFSQLQMWSKRSSTDTLPNQTVRWTWYADSNSSIGIGDRTLQLWAYPYSSAVPSSLAIFDQWLKFQYPTFTETTINLVTGSTGNLTVGGRYIITDLGTTTQAQWNTIAGQSGVTYVVGSWFNAATTGVEAVGTTGQVLYQSWTRKTSIYTDLDLYGATAAQSISSTYIANTGSNSSALSILNKNTSGGSGAYSIYMQGNDLNDNRFVIFTNSSTRTSDGGAGNTTLRTDYGQLRLSSASNGLYISSGLNFAITSISGATTLNDTHLVVLAGGTTSYIVTLPAGASSNTGRTYYIKKTSTSSYTLTITPTSPSTIDGATSIAFTTQYMSYTVVSDGANWFVI